MNAIGTSLKRTDPIKGQEMCYKMHIHIFEVMLVSAERAGTYLAEEKKGSDAYFSASSQRLLSISELLITCMFNIALSPAIRNEQRIWNKMRDFCVHWLTTQVLILIWQQAVVDATSTLADSLAAMGNDDYKVLSDANLAPFEGLPMKKEYSLQVLFNAHSAMIQVPHEEMQKFIETSKYKLVYQTSIYKSFDIWLNLLKLIQLPPGFKNKSILSEYIKSILFIMTLFV